MKKTRSVTAAKVTAHPNRSERKTVEVVRVPRAAVPDDADGHTENPIAPATVVNVPDTHFAAVSAEEAKALSLTPAQRTAIEKITSGHTLVDAATAAGVNRVTLYRWLKHDPEFQAAYNSWQQDALATARGRLLALTDTAVTTINKAMLNGDGRLALKILERLGVADRPQTGATDVEELKFEQALEQRKRQLERQKEQDQLMMDELSQGTFGRGRGS